MKNIPQSTRSKCLQNRTLVCVLVCTVFLIMLSACEGPPPPSTPIIPTFTETDQTIKIFPTVTIQTSTPIPSHTSTPGPSPTSTALPNLEPKSWQAQPIMVKAARIDADPFAPLSYTPFFVLYGDGLLVKRTCQNGECRYLQTQLDPQTLCRLVNTIDRTGFLDANPTAFDLPGGTGAAIHMVVRIYAENSVQIPDLDRWVEDPDWYGALMGCPSCFAPPKIDPAFIDLYRLLITYTDTDMTGLHTERLAVWLTRPVITGTAQPWPSELIPLSELAEKGTCPNNPEQRQAVILEGPSARAVSSLLSTQGEGMPIFFEDGTTWQVVSRWLLPYEMPQTCDLDAGLYPPPGESVAIWQCDPEMGTIPTATATITPTPTTTPTPLR